MTPQEKSQALRNRRYNYIPTIGEQLIDKIDAKIKEQNEKTNTNISPNNDSTTS